LNEYLMHLLKKPQLSIMMVCLGNICRSPMAAAVLSNKTKDWTSPKIVVSSSGTGSWHIGDGPNEKSKLVWEEAGYVYEHIAQQFKEYMFNEQDLLLVMDKSNFQNLHSLTSNKLHTQKIFYLKQFDPSFGITDVENNYEDLEIPDPYYEPISAYQNVLQMVEKSIDGLLSFLRSGK